MFDIIFESPQYRNARRQAKNECRVIAARALELAKKWKHNPTMFRHAMGIYHRNEQVSR
jgi:hypothetical protein